MVCKYEDYASRMTTSQIVLLLKQRDQLRTKNERLKEANRWIPVNERLPEKDIDHTTLVFSDNKEQCFIHEADYIDGKFYTITGHEIYWITHWKPIFLPQTLTK